MLETLARLLVYGLFTLRGLPFGHPPFFAFSRAASVLASDVASPPRFPIAAKYPRICWFIFITATIYPSCLVIARKICNYFSNEKWHCFRRPTVVGSNHSWRFRLPLGWTWRPSKSSPRQPFFFRRSVLRRHTGAVSIIFIKINRPSRW